MLTRPRGAVYRSDEAAGFYSLIDFPGVTGDGVTDDTVALQAAYDEVAAASGTLFVPSGIYRQTLIIVPSNLTVVCAPGVVFSALSTLNINDSLYELNGTMNFTLVGNGAVFTMGGLFTTGEQRHAFDLRGVFNIRLFDCEMRDCGGDAVRVAQTLGGGAAFSEDVWVERCRMRANRRQGVSITSAKNLYITDCIIEETGAGPSGFNSPGYGIDIEPNTLTDEIQNIQINNLTTLNNGVVGMGGGGITIALFNFDNSGKQISIRIRNHNSIGDVIGFSTGATNNTTTPVDGDVTYEDATILSSKRSGVFVDRWSSIGPPLYVRRPKIFNPNTSNSLSSIFGSGLFVGRAAGAGGAATIGNVTIENPDIFDGRTPGLMQIAMMLKDFDSDELRQVHVINPIRLGWSDPAFGLLDKVDHRGTGAVSDNNRRLVGSRDASFTLAPETYVRTYDTRAMTATRTVTLDDNFPFDCPEITFRVNNNERLRLQAAPGSVLTPGGGANGVLQSDRQGAQVTLFRVSNSAWGVVEESRGWFRGGEGVELDSLVITGTTIETDLAPDVTIPANALQPGDALGIRLGVLVGGTNDTKLIRIRFGGQALFSPALPAGSTGSAEITGFVYRLSTSVRYMFRFQSSSGIIVQDTDTAAIDLSFAQLIKPTVQLGNGGDSVTRLIWHRFYQFNLPE